MTLRLRSMIVYIERLHGYTDTFCIDSIFNSFLYTDKTREIAELADKNRHSNQQYIYIFIEKCFFFGKCRYESA